MKIPGTPDTFLNGPFSSTKELNLQSDESYYQLTNYKGYNHYFKIAGDPTKVTEQHAKALVDKRINDDIALGNAIIKSDKIEMKNAAQILFDLGYLLSTQSPVIWFNDDSSHPSRAVVESRDGKTTFYSFGKNLSDAINIVAKFTRDNAIAGSGHCNKCSCPSFRGDSDEPEEHCVNIRPPSQQLCGHLKSEHR